MSSHSLLCYTVASLTVCLAEQTAAVKRKLVGAGEGVGGRRGALQCLSISASTLQNIAAVFARRAM